MVAKRMVDPYQWRTKLMNSKRVTESVACTKSGPKEFPSHFSDETSCLSRANLLKDRNLFNEEVIDEAGMFLQKRRRCNHQKRQQRTACTQQLQHWEPQSQPPQQQKTAPATATTLQGHWSRKSSKRTGDHEAQAGHFGKDTLGRCGVCFQDG